MPKRDAPLVDRDGVPTEPWLSAPCGTEYIVFREHPTAKEAAREAARLNREAGGMPNA